MVSVLEVDLRIDTTFAGGVEEISNERKWVAILFSDFVESAEVYA